MSSNVIDAQVITPQSENTSAELALELASSQLPDTVRTNRAPVIVLEEARKAAVALLDVLKSKPKGVVFNGERYIENEDWQTVGHFYGITSKIESDAFVQFGNVSGFEATAVAIDRTGREVSRAVAMCLNDEENWSTRPKHEWHYVVKSTNKTQKEDPGRDEIVWEGDEGKRKPKKVKVQVADEPVPLFQLRSMAQTRACSRVLRQVLGFVPVLAGYRATPAEELNGAERVDAEFVTNGAGVRPATEDDKRDKPRATGVVDAAFDDVTTKSEPKPQSKSAAAAAATPAEAAKPVAPTSDRYHVARVVKLREGTSSKGPWTKYGVITTELGESKTLATFDEKQARVAHACKRDGKLARIRFETTSKNGYTDHTIADITLVEPSDAQPTPQSIEQREPGEEG